MCPEQYSLYFLFAGHRLSSQEGKILNLLLSDEISH